MYKKVQLQTSHWTSSDFITFRPSTTSPVELAARQMVAFSFTGVDR
jgi:hypothetical protein